MPPAKKTPTFPSALAALLKQRGIPVPAGLVKAPPEAYAHQPASLVEQLASLEDDALAKQAAKIAGYAKRHAERAKQMWDSSPVIVELRRRKLTEPPQPRKVVGAAFSLKKPVGDWTDAELIEAATLWSDRGS